MYTFEKGSSGQGIYRIIAVGGVIAFCVWAFNQPTDFDTFITAQSDFMSDLYAGKLLSDVSQVRQLVGEPLNNASVLGNPPNVNFRETSIFKTRPIEKASLHRFSVRVMYLWGVC